MQRVESTEVLAEEALGRQLSCDGKALMSRVSDYILDLMVGKRDPRDLHPHTGLDPQPAEDRCKSERLLPSLELHLTSEFTRSKEVSLLSLNKIKPDPLAEEASATLARCADSQSSIPSKKLLVCSKENLFNRALSNSSRNKQATRIEFFSHQKEPVEGTQV